MNKPVVCKKPRKPVTFENIQKLSLSDFVCENEDFKTYKLKKIDDFTIVFVYSNTCGYCMSTKPEYEKFFKMFNCNTNFKICRVNGPESQIEFPHFPIFMLFKNKKLIKHTSGSSKLEDIVKFIDF